MIATLFTSFIILNNYPNIVDRVWISRRQMASAVHHYARTALRFSRFTLVEGERVKIRSAKLDC